MYRSRIPSSSIQPSSRTTSLAEPVPSCLLLPTKTRNSIRQMTRTPTTLSTMRRTPFPQAVLVFKMPSLPHPLSYRLWSLSPSLSCPHRHEPDGLRRGVCHSVPTSDSFVTRLSVACVSSGRKRNKRSVRGKAPSGQTG